MDYPEPDGQGIAEEPVATRYPTIEARVAGLVGSILVGFVVGVALHPTFAQNEKGQVMALALLAIVPFLLALLPADPKARLVALALATPLGLVSMVVSTIGPLVLLVGPLLPLIIGVALILGLSGLATGRQRAKDGSLALAILGLSPAVSCLVVFLADYLVGSLLGLPWGRMGAPPRPMMVFAIAVAVSVLAVVAVALLWMLQRRRGVPSKPEPRRELDEFDRD
jgi:hypothetical protein